MSSSFPMTSAALPSSGVVSYPSAVPNTNQVVVPQITIPAALQTMFTPQVQTPVQQPPQAAIEGPKLARINNGLDGAKAFPTQANAEYAIFEEDDDVFYFKKTDKNNFPEVLKRYRFYEEAEPVPEAPPAYVTVDEFRKISEELEDIKKQLGIADENEAVDGEDAETRYSKALEEIERLKAENKTLKEGTQHAE